jgi:hypothetical protein
VGKADVVLVVVIVMLEPTDQLVLLWAESLSIPLRY